MKTALLEHLSAETQALREGGLFKGERVISSPQQAVVTMADGRKAINLCANNYLGLANHPAVIEAGSEAVRDHGFGMASVRFICGTQAIHKELEARLSEFLGTEDTILYSSCFDANGGLFETLLDADDAVISDALNHASIIDGIRLCKAKRFRYKNNDMQDLERCLEEARDSRFRIIASDGVFSMDGIIANLRAVCDLAERYQAMVMVDDCHAAGVIGKRGRGTHEYCDVMGRVDIITGTLGKALGGASGGYTSGPREVIDWLRQRSRPYLFSNTLAPAITTTTLKVLDMIDSDDTLLSKLEENSAYFRRGMSEAGFTLAGKDHPIIPVMLGDARLAQTLAEKLLAEGIYVIAFSYPVVPKGQARIRTQISAAHERTHLDQAIDAFTRIGRELHVIA